MFRGVVEDGRIHSQPFSEGLAPGATAGVATRARPVENGWRVSGRKIFASLSGAANFYNVICQVPGEDTIRFLGVPADATGVSCVDDWDPLGMRGTVSRTLLMDDAFVPVGERVASGRGLQPGCRALPVAVLVAVPELPGSNRWSARRHPRVLAWGVARPSGGCQA